MYERCLTIMAVLLLTAVHTSFCAAIPWTNVRGGLKSVSVGGTGVWGVNSANRVYYRLGTYRNQASSGSDWLPLSVSLKQVDVGRDVVWGVSQLDNVFYRRGISTYK
ncbi:hypothetical protein ACOMHN_057282 [Nucella lapillus]